MIRQQPGDVLEIHFMGYVSTEWRSPNTGCYYRITLARAFETTSGPCRKFAIDVKVGGRTEQVYEPAAASPTEAGNFRV